MSKKQVWRFAQIVCLSKKFDKLHFKIAAHSDYVALH